MPTYDYECSNCQVKKEIFQKITDCPLTWCEVCQSKSLKKMCSCGIGLSFQGTGFYKTDYKNSH